MKVGIGVHSGELVAGVIGSGSRMEFTIIGDTVNTAARLESLTKEHGVSTLVSGATAARVSGFPLRELGDASIRGRLGTLKLFALD